MVFTPQEKGSDPHSHHKRKFAHEEADSDRLREAVFEKGYKHTTLAEINEKAGVSFSQF